jgi:carboxylate-amine ligase
MDAQSRLESVAGLAALIHGLALACADGAAPAPPPGPGLTETSFRAGRDGLDATIWSRTGCARCARSAAAALLLARPRLREHGGDGALDGIERILREGNGADRMRAAHAAGGMRGVLELLAAETAGVSSWPAPGRGPRTG